ncbi:Organellar oligopeptidase A, chloroplastic/mitochondrial [Halotydeus destructor]|nr:Organellar oligopeptidase A, chloroplastic/mitochondrial [Halotydeus destructor]
MNISSCRKCISSNWKLLLRKERCTSSFSSRHNSGGFYIIAPDMPADTEKDNALLKTPRDGQVTPYSELTMRKCFRAFVKRELEFEAAIDDIDASTETDKAQSRTFDEVYSEIESRLVPLNYTSATISHLNATAHSRFPFVKTYERNAYRAKSKRFTSRTIHDYMREYNSDKDKLNKYQRRVVEKYLLEGKLNGLNLSSSEMAGLNFLTEKIETQRTKFRSNVSGDTEAFRRVVMDAKLLGVLPDGYASPIARGSSNENLNLASEYNLFMENCSERQIREEVWLKYYTRAFKSNSATNNSVVIEEIRSSRHDQARLLGLENYVELSMKTKMAESLDVVKAMINTLHAGNQEYLERDLSELLNFANSVGPSVDKIQLWDIDYYRNRYVTENFDLDHEKIRKYFSVESVLNGLFDFANRLFQVHIEEVKKENFESWHPTVRLFRVLSPNGTVGSFFFDPYHRPIDKKMIGITVLLNRSGVCDTQTITSWSMDLQSGSQGQNSNLSFRDVLSVFKQFGFVLQSCLSEAPYSEINGFNNTEWDLLKMMPEFMSLWALHDYRTLAGCSSHSDTKEQLPQQIHSQLRDSHFKFTSFETNKQLYRSALDMALYSNSEFWEDVKDETWKIYAQPFDMHRKEAHLCSFSEIMSEQYAANYYGFLWSKMLAADMFTGFQAANHNEEAIGKLGLKFRDTFLSNLGAVAGKDLFREFMQRDPLPENLFQMSESKAQLLSP